MNPAAEPRPLLILDLGNVVVDESTSHIETARRAAGAYFEEICGIELGSRLITDDLLRAFAQLPGFDRHLALAFALVYHILAGLSPPLRPPPARKTRAAQVRAAFKRLDLRFGMLLGLVERDISEELEAIRQAGGGVAGLLKATRHDSIEGHILHTGELDIAEREAAAPDRASRERLAATPENVLLRLCEEIYLGDEAFAAIYGVPPLQPRGSGVVHDEQPLLTPEQAAQFAACADLALIANRPPALVRATLQRLQLTPYLPVWETPATEHGAVRRGEWMTLRPATLLRLVQAAQLHYGRTWSPREILLVVDSLPDIAAAVEADLWPIGLGAPLHLLRPLFKEAGARTVISRLETLLKGLERQQGDPSPTPGE